LAESHASNDIFEHLIVNYVVYFERSLHALAASGNIAALKKVVQWTPSGSAAMGRDDRGRSVLHNAAAEGHTDMCEYLLDANIGSGVVGVDSEGNTPLHLAVMGEHIDTAAFLVHRGGSMDTMNKTGSSVWALASVVSASCAKEIQDGAASFQAGNLRQSKRAVEKLDTPSKKAQVVSPRANTPPISASGPIVSVTVPAAALPAPTSISATTIPPPRPKAKDTFVTVTSTHEEVMVALQAAAPPVPRRGSMGFGKGSSKDVTAAEPTPQQVVMKQVRVSVAKNLSSRVSQVDTTQYVWQHIVAEPFYEISPLISAVGAFCVLLCNAERANDPMEVRQSLKDVARGLQTFFKAIDALVKPFQEDDSLAVREVAGRLKDCASELLAVVRDVSTAAASKEGTQRSGAKNNNQARLEQQAFHLATICLELFEVIELSRYRVINMGMQKTAEEAAALTKASGPAEVTTHRAELKSAATALASAVVNKALKLCNESLAEQLLKQQTELLQLVRDIRHPDASSTTRAQLAKAIIVSFRGVKASFKEADELVMNEQRTDGELVEWLCSQLLEIRAPEDYVPATKSEGQLLAAVASVHNALDVALPFFVSAEWRGFGNQFNYTMTAISHVLSVARQLLSGCSADSESAVKVSCLLSSLEYHMARVTLVLAHAIVVNHSVQPDRDVSLRQVVYPTLSGHTRPAIAVAGLVTSLLLAVPTFFKIANQE
jgi:hypothetical protein